MFGSFQSSILRVEVAAEAATLRRCLLEPSLLRRWVGPQELDPAMTDPLQSGSRFRVSLGPIWIEHEVEQLGQGRLRLLMWGAMDGFTEWSWGNGWIQSRVEAVSLLPLALGQALMLRQLQAFAATSLPPS